MKNLYHFCDNRQRKRLTSFSWSVAISAAVSQGWCVAAISSVCVYVCLSGTTTPHFLRRSGAPVTPTNSRQAGWETDLSSCFRKAKIYHGERIFEAVGGINVGDYMYLRRDVRRDEGATARVWQKSGWDWSLLILWSWKCSPEPIRFKNSAPICRFAMICRWNESKGSRLPKVPSALPDDVQVIIPWEFITVT